MAKDKKQLLEDIAWHKGRAEMFRKNARALNGVRCDDAIKQANREEMYAIRYESMLTKIEAKSDTCYVTMSQMAAIVSRGKKTIVRLVERGILPQPDIEGGGGKPHEWRWATVKPILESQFDRIMPAIFPHDRFVR